VKRKNKTLERYQFQQTPLREWLDGFFQEANGRPLLGATQPRRGETLYRREIGWFQCTWTEETRNKVTLRATPLPGDDRGRVYRRSSCSDGQSPLFAECLNIFTRGTGEALSIGSIGGLSLMVTDENLLAKGKVFPRRKSLRGGLGRLKHLH